MKGRIVETKMLIRSKTLHSMWTWSLEKQLLRRRWAINWIWKCFIPCIKVAKSHFWQEEGHTIARYFVELDFWLKLTYFCDIFDKLNALNLSLQSSNILILKLFQNFISKRTEFTSEEVSINSLAYNSLKAKFARSDLVEFFLTITRLSNSKFKS